MENIRDRVKKAMAGDRNAFAEIVEHFQDMAVGYAYSMLGDYHLAQDAAQESFIQALGSLNTLRDPGMFPAWFKTIIFFRCNRIQRKKSLKTESLNNMSIVSNAGTEPENIFIRKEEHSFIWNAIGNLPDQERAIVTLYYMNEYSQKEIGAFLGIPVSMVNNRLHASRKKLKKELFAMFEDRISNIKPSKDDVFRKKVIEGVMEIGHAETNWTMLCHFGASLTAAVTAIGEKTDYGYIMGASGMAFRMVWLEGWHAAIDSILFMAEDPFEPVRRAFDAVGYRYSIRHITAQNIDPGSDLNYNPVWVDRNQAAKEIKDSIDNGIPAISLSHPGGPITGYEEDGKVILGLNPDGGSSGDDDAVPAGFFRTSNWHKTTPAYILIGERKPLPPKRRFHVDALRYAVQLTRSPKINGIYRGLEAYTAWAKQLMDKDFPVLEAGKGFGDASDTLWHRFLVHCNGLCMIHERSNAAIFLRKMAEDEPDMAIELNQAAEYYSEESKFGGALWQHVTYDDEGVKKLKDRKIREILASHIKQSRDLEEKAVECLEALLERVDPD